MRLLVGPLILLGAAGYVHWYNLDGASTQRFLVLPFMSLVSETTAGQAQWTVGFLVGLAVLWFGAEILARGLRRRTDGK